METLSAPAPILEDVKLLILEWAKKELDPYEKIRAGKKIPESTIARILDPKEHPSEKTLLGFNAINFEEATGLSVYGFIIEKAKKGLWGDADHLPQILTHDDLVNSLGSMYRKDEEERFKMLSIRAGFDSRRDLQQIFSGRPLFWRKIPGILEVIAYYEKKIEPRGEPKGESAFCAETNAPKVIKQSVSEIQMETVGIGHAVTSVIATANLLNSLTINPNDVTQVQRLGIVRALVSIAQKFDITPSSLERGQMSPSGSAAIEVLFNALGGAKRSRR